MYFLNDNRDSLYQRINNRVDQMIKHGLVEEVRQIGIENFSITSKVAIGYKEMIEYLKGNIDLDEAIELIKKILVIMQKDNILGLRIRCLRLLFLSI